MVVVRTALALWKIYLVSFVMLILLAASLLRTVEKAVFATQIPIVEKFLSLANVLKTTATPPLTESL